MALTLFKGTGGGAFWRGLLPASGGSEPVSVPAMTLFDPVTGTAMATNEDQYEAVAASATDQVLGATGATGDFIAQLIIQPTTTAAGTVTLKDGTTVIFTFTSGTLSNLAPIIVPLGLTSVNGAWKVTTGTNVAALGCGRFT